MREHIMAESLIRYAITITCIFTIDALILAFFDWGARSMLMGFTLCLFLFALKQTLAAIRSCKPNKSD